MPAAMESGGLAEIQHELQAVKRALRDGAVHLGMRGENLQRYLLQLNEKENLLLSQQLRHMSVSGAADGLDSYAAGAMANGFGGAALLRAAAKAPAREPPPGPPKVFNRDDVVEVLMHMSEYEAVPQECNRALRALSTLAYADASRVGSDDRVIQQLLRLLALHPSDENIQIGAMRALCNMAYDQVVAVTRLVEPGVSAALLAAVARPEDLKDKAKGGEASAKAGEAVARIVAAEVNPDGDVATTRPPPDARGPLASLFLTASAGEASWQAAIPRLVSQLVANEVVEPAAIAERFAIAGLSASCNSVAVGWLNLAKQLSAMDATCPELPQALVDAGAIRTAAQLMERLAHEGATQLAGVEAMSALVGNRWAGLQAFAEVGGMRRIEAAMSSHGGDSVLQTKGVRALASGIQWPEDVQQKAGYNPRKAVELTKAAMAQHGDCIELVQAVLEALSKYLDKLRCKEDVAEGGGEGLVKAAMVRHAAVPQVQQLGRAVLEGLGVGRGWAPGSAQQS